MQTVQRLLTIASIATTLNAEQREQIRNSPPGALSFILTGFANSNNPAGGGVQHGQHLAHRGEQNQPLSNLYVNMLQRLGIETDHFGTSTGTLTGLHVA